MSALPIPMPRTFTLFILHPSMLLTDHRPSGDGLLAFEFIRRLALRGHTLHVAVSLQDLKDPLPPNVHLYDIGTRTTASPFGASLPNRIEFGLRAGRLLRRLQRTIRFDAVHQLNPVIYGLSYFARIRNLPLVMGPFPPAWPAGAEHAQTLKRRIVEGIRTPLIRHQFARATRLLPANAFAARQLNIPLEGNPQVSILPFGIDTAIFSDQPATRPEVPTILFLSNLWRRKGIFTLLDAFEHVHARMPHARLLIAGSGSDGDEVAARVAIHPARRQITLTGRVPRAEVPATLRSSTVFCVPSFGEPGGTATLEAMSCGCAVIVTRAGGMPDLTSPEGALLVPPGDPTALSEALLRVLANPILAATMGRHNATRVSQHFSWPVVLDRLESIYTSCTTQSLR